jgi:hypothetical protein
MACGCHPVLNPMLADAAGEGSDIGQKESGSCIRTRHRPELVRDGKNAVVVTPTASGKTLCYNLPVLNAVLGFISHQIG